MKKKNATQQNHQEKVYDILKTLDSPAACQTPIRGPESVTLNPESRGISAQRRKLLV